MNSKEQFEIVENGLLVRAPAKINLSLLVAGKRPDGFHELETIMAKVGFYDEILIRQGQKSGIELVCKGPYWAPDGEENLVYKAAELLLQNCGSLANVSIVLTKNIPAGSGLGSASSDAAATLTGLNRFLRLGVGEQRLGEIAADLGSDVTFFLAGPRAFCTGKGEKVEKLSGKFNFLVLLILPDISVSTKRVYANYRHDSTIYKKLSATINSYIQKNRIDLASKVCANMLRVSCFGLYEKLAELKAKIEALGIRPLCLSGSGSAMFYITDAANKKETAENKRKIEEEIGCKSIIVSSNKW